MNVGSLKRETRRYCPVAQLVEHATVNRGVEGSNPSGTAIKSRRVVKVWLWPSYAVNLLILGAESIGKIRLTLPSRYGRLLSVSRREHRKMASPKLCGEFHEVKQ